MTKKVTIVVPIYNVREYIHKCVNSIINQTYNNLEIILVDDGSPDSCPQICDDYARIDTRIKVIHKENGGLSDARNAGLEKATGDYILFVDGDDYAEPNMVEIALNAAQSNNNSVVIWSYFADYVDEKETLLNTVVFSHPTGTFYKEQFNSIKINYDLIRNLGYAWNKMYKLELLKNNNFKFTKGLSLVEDIVFNSQVLSQSESIVFLDQPLIHYMQRPRTTLGTMYYDNYFEIKKKGLNAVKKLLISWNIEDIIISKTMSLLGFVALKITTRVITNAKNLTQTKKKLYLEEVLHDSMVLEILKDVHPVSIKDRVICKLMQTKQSNLLLFSYKTLIRTRIRNN